VDQFKGIALLERLLNFPSQWLKLGLYFLQQLYHEESSLRQHIIFGTILGDN